MPRFSICIPNYNYAQYVDKTIKGVLDQDFADFEIVVADNASTDDSVAVIEGFADPRITVRVNRWNVGFAGNLDRAHAGATGDHMMLMSSDDVMLPGALATYDRLLTALGEEAGRAVLFSNAATIDGQGKRIGDRHGDPKLWSAAVRDERLSEIAGAPVLRMNGAAMLRRSLELLRMPAIWVSMCYPRALYEAVEGYGGGRLYGPDKLFTWKLLSQGGDVLLVEKELFEYRWHQSNQASLEKNAGTLRHLTDEYLNSFDLPQPVLDASGLAKSDLAEAFVEQDIALRGLQMLAQGRRSEARRMLDFGRAAYPAVTARNRKARALRGLLALGPVGETAARRLYDRAAARWAAEQARAAASSRG